MELPEEALPVFAFPRDLRLQINSLSEYPLPVYYTFVFTDQEGHHQYAACLKFFERVPLSDLAHIAMEIWGEDVVRNRSKELFVFLYFFLAGIGVARRSRHILSQSCVPLV